MSRAAGGDLSRGPRVETEHVVRVRPRAAPDEDALKAIAALGRLAVDSDELLELAKPGQRLERIPEVLGPLFLRPPPPPLSLFVVHAPASRPLAVPTPRPGRGRYGRTGDSP